jgi:predicted SprT family Zn-dependent metalloprotease
MSKIIEEARRIRDELAKQFPQWKDKLWGMTFCLNTRMHTCAGRATYSTQLVELSEAIFSDPANFYGLDRTVRHEIAHLLVGKGHGHGRVWRAICLAIGGDGRRCHGFNVQRNRRQPRSETATCLTCLQEFKVTKRKARSIAKRSAHHVGCGGQVAILHEINK